MSTAAVPIYQGQDFWVPRFELKLDERKQGQDIIHDITQVTYKDNLTEVDSFDLTVNNWDAEERRFKYSDDTLFDPGKKIKLFMGYYPDKLEPMLSGEITSLKPSFPSGGQPTLSVSGLNILHRLRSEPRSVAFFDSTDSDVMKKIAGDLNVAIDVKSKASEQKYDYLLQDNQPDRVFLLQRARRVGYELTVTEDKQGAPKLTFKPSQDIRPAEFQLSYGRSLMEFQPDLDTSNQVGEVTVRGWDRLNKKPITATAKRSQLATQGVGQAGGQKAIDDSIKNKKEIIATLPIETVAEAEQLAKETLERIAKNMLKATGSTVGVPGLRAGTVLRIDGVGQRFSGRYFVTSTTHTIGDSGYAVQFECRREEL